MNQVQNQAPATQTAKHLVDNVLHTLVEVGSMWAVHGLRIGKMALTTSAETLGKTAAVLDTMAVELQKKHPPTNPPAAPTDEPAAPGATPADPGTPAN